MIFHVQYAIIRKKKIIILLFSVMDVILLSIKFVMESKIFLQVLGSVVLVSQEKKRWYVLLCSSSYFILIL